MPTSKIEDETTSRAAPEADPTSSDAAPAVRRGRKPRIRPSADAAPASTPAMDASADEPAPVAAPPAPTPALASSPRQLSKAEQVLRLLRRKRGASILELREATGWQAHSVRGFLSATIRKRMGLELSSEPAASGERRYRVAQP